MRSDFSLKTDVTPEKTPGGYKFAPLVAKVVPASKTHIFFFRKSSLTRGSVFKVSGDDISLSRYQWKRFIRQTMRFGKPSCSAKGKHRQGGGQVGAPC